ncbi:MAG: acetyl-CoA carboxylase biotin carboxyl carrier protein [Candidatus Latescibacteria bacterium]|nr:acetyl-CoA carboxylase biotin carboxyl carrier protein [Candidatus Latescibacterota bacterium]MCK5380537.1 acetyl-CoA carboxylase biotin carboxyl carrier protein [Candidatus Latescibacterota bacterium]
MKEKEIRKLIQLVEESEIHELEVSRWGRKIRITKHGAVATAHASVVHPTPLPSSEPETEAPPPPQEEVGEEILHEIVSPMVGLFYRAPDPDSEPFVKEGDHVTAGQTVCIVEAMKVLNEIESDAEGTIMRIMVESAQPVEYGQPLFLLKPQT